MVDLCAYLCYVITSGEIMEFSAYNAEICCAIICTAVPLLLYLACVVVLVKVCLYVLDAVRFGGGRR